MTATPRKVTRPFLMISSTERLGSTRPTATPGAPELEYSEAPSFRVRRSGSRSCLPFASLMRDSGIPITVATLFASNRDVLRCPMNSKRQRQVSRRLEQRNAHGTRELSLSACARRVYGPNQRFVEPHFHLVFTQTQPRGVPELGSSPTHASHCWSAVHNSSLCTSAKPLVPGQIVSQVGTPVLGTGKTESAGLRHGHCAKTPSTQVQCFRPRLANPHVVSHSSAHGMPALAHSGSQVVRPTPPGGVTAHAALGSVRVFGVESASTLEQLGRLEMAPRSAAPISVTVRLFLILECPRRRGRSKAARSVWGVSRLAPRERRVATTRGHHAGATVR